jgi:exopolysaccharide production repressor protein
MVTALKRWMRLMSAPAAFLQTVVVAAVFGIATYMTVDNGLTALLLTLSCFVLLQIGYFAGILYMVWSERRKRRG